MEKYLSQLREMKDFCEEFRREIIDVIFTDGETKEVLETTEFYFYCWFPKYRRYWEVIRDIVEIGEMLGISLLEQKTPILRKCVAWLGNPESVELRTSFENYVDRLKNAFKDVEKEVEDRLQLLAEEETSRLNEALNCYVGGCNYAAVAMAVSAVEYRLLSLMQLAKPDPELEECPLGRLIGKYLEDKKAYKNVIPKKHEPLLNLCNTYRIFSVHPKREKITRPIATSILNMTFVFLLDEKLKHKAEKHANTTTVAIDSP